MFDLQSTAETEGRQSEAKVWSVLIEQIWVGLPGYCWGSPDLKQVYSNVQLLCLFADMAHSLSR